MMRIATWNLERPKLGGSAKNGARLNQIRSIDADLWILTETSSAIDLSGYTSHPTSPPPQRENRSPGENYATILSRWPVLRTLNTWNSVLSVCVEVHAPIGLLLAYGTIITYANDRGDDGASKRWIEHRKSIDSHRRDWLRLRREYPNHGFVVAGDFNQSRDGSGWYEDRKSVESLTKAFEATDLRCLTQEDFRIKFKLNRANIDHICIAGPLANCRCEVGAWPGTANRVRMSDHNGAYVHIDA